jgi:CTP:molybdopterin cytidylyltransferase MocA
MGGPKALMPFRAAPWWRAQRTRLDAWHARELWIVSPSVDAAMRNDPDAPLRLLGDPDAPMFTSLALGLAHFAAGPPGAVSVLPVDVPACTALTHRALRTPTDTPTVPTLAGLRGHPIRLPWPFIATTILPHHADPAWIASARLDNLVRSVAREVAVDDPSVRTNLNTPEDLARWAAESSA